MSLCLCGVVSLNRLSSAISRLLSGELECQRRGMNENQTRVVVASWRHGTAAAGVGAARRDAGDAGQGHLPDLVRREGAGRVRARRGDAAFVLVRTEARKIVQGVLQKDPACAMAYWGLAVICSAIRCGGAVAEGRGRGRLGGPGEGADVAAKTQRERDWIEAMRRLLSRRRHDAASRRGCAPITRRWSRWRSATRTTSKRRSSTR